jgi:hypothetical protein
MARERLSTLLILELTDHGWSQTLREHDRKLIHQDRNVFRISRPNRSFNEHTLMR